MMKTKAFRLASIFLVVWLFPALLGATYATPPQVQSPPAGEYQVLIEKAGAWQPIVSLSFGQRFTTRTLDLSGSCDKAQPARIRLLQKGGGAAHIDAVLLGGAPPRKVDSQDPELALKKLSAQNFDVVDAFGKTIEVEFPGNRSDSVLSLTARVEPEAISKVPFQFPSANLFKPIDRDARFFTYHLNGSPAESSIATQPGPPDLPLFKEYCRTGSGHPSGYTYGWVWNDAEKLYVKLDFTPDNTMDGNKDYAAVHVKTDQGIKRFEIREANQQWGQTLFTYADTVDYQHKLYQFAIPLSELGLSRSPKTDGLMLAFSAYGTAAAGPPLPGIDIISGGDGVKTFTLNSSAPTTHLSHWVMVTDYDGIAADGSSHTVTVTYPDSTIKALVFTELLGGSSYARYELWDDETPQPFDIATNTGNYTYRATDPSGDWTVAVENFVPDPVGVVDESTFTIQGLDTTTPLISWAPVTDAVHYLIRIEDTSGSWIHSGYTSVPEYQIPPGKLAPANPYRYRVNAFKNHLWFQWDNTSETELIDFVSGSAVTNDPHIKIDSFGVSYRGDDPIHGPSTNFWITVHDGQGVPSDIREVRVLFPDGQTEVKLFPYEMLSSTACNYYNSYHGPASGGTYQFTVVDKEGHSHTVSDELIIAPLDALDLDSLFPVDEVVLNDTGAAFSWDPVAGAAYYRFDVFDKDLNRVFSHRTEDTQVIIPPGLAQENSYYRYRIRVYGEFNEDNISNQRDVKEWEYFSFFTTATYGTNTPVLNIGNFGVAVKVMPHPADPDDRIYQLHLSARVDDLDGVPENISQVEVVFPDGTSRFLKYDDVPGLGYNYSFTEFFSDPASIQDASNSSGVYEFRVEDFDGNVVSLQDTLPDVGANVIDRPTNVYPGDQTDVFTDAPTITWDAVDQATYYLVHIEGGVITPADHWSPTLVDTQYTIPAGLLAQDDSYELVVYAIREAAGNEIDFYSSSRYLLDNINFTVRSGEDTDGDGLPDFWERQIIDADPGDAIATIADVLPGDDFDGDGITNEDEFNSGTSPTNQDTGSISGTVRDNTLSPLEGVDVYALDADSHSRIAETITDASGTYTITGLPTDGYYVLARRDGFGTIYYGGYAPSLAQIVDVNAPDEVPGIDFTLQPEGTISGIVLDSIGSPIEGATVYAAPFEGGDTIQATTDATGNYTIDQRATGEYVVFARSTGYATEYYPNVMSWNQATSVAVNSGADTPGIDFQLDVPAGNIAGRVTVDGGAGIAGAQVDAFSDRCYQNHLGWGHTDADGNYLIESLPQGDVYLHVRVEGQNYLEEWYDGAGGTQDCNAAAPFAVTAGTTTLDWSLTRGFLFDATVKSVRNYDGNYYTQFVLEIDESFVGAVPDDIDAISITGPSGNLPYDVGDFLYYPPREFYLSIPGAPEIGSYTITVTSGGISSAVTDAYTVFHPIPVPDLSNASPRPNATISSLTPLFKWELVDYDATPLYYRLEIRDAATDYTVYMTPRTLDLDSFALPAGTLDPGGSYNWRIRVSDSDNWLDVQNRSQTDWVPFVMDATLGHPAMPVVDLDGWGVVTKTRENGTGLDFWVKVIDHDGIASDNSGYVSHTVLVTPPVGDPGYLALDRVEDGKTVFFSGWVGPGDITVPIENFNGIWTFTVTDPAGNTFSVVDTLTVAPLPVPDEASFQPANGSTLTDTTPTFNWAPVTGTNAENILRHRVRIYSDDLSQTVWRGYLGTETSYTVPPGVLAPSTAYRYRIEAWDAHSSFENDNVSQAPLDSATYLRFTTGPESPDPYIDLADSGVHTWSGSSYGSTLSFWVRVHDPQGVPGDIASVKAILPGGEEVQLRHDYNENPTSAIYQASTFDPITSGTYTLRVEDLEGNSYETTEELDSNPIGFPAESSFLPVRSSLIGSTAVNFDWEDVSGSAFYRVEIYDENFERIYTFATTESQYSLPEGYLEEGKYYAYRITTRREFFDQNEDNGSSSPWYSSNRFNLITTAAPGSTSPTLDTDNWGVLLWHNPRPDNPATSNYWMGFNVKVTDPDGPPHCIQRVQVTFPDGTTTRTLGYDGNDGEDAAWYWYMEHIADPTELPEGVYTFSAIDVNGNTAATVTDTFTRNVLPQPTNLSPLPDSDVYGTTPTISWDPVDGAALYRVEIYNESGSRIHRPHTTETAYTVPADVLELDHTYSYRVRAYREDFNVEDMDNMSSSMWFENLRPHFTVLSDVDADGDGLPDAWERQIVDADASDSITSIDDVLPGDDFDGDGITNEDEFNAGTSPTSQDGGAISGQVTDAAMAPLEGVRVYALSEDFGSFIAEDYTDASGNYTISDLAGGSYRLVASGTGYGTTYYGGYSDPLSQLITVSVPNTTSGIDFALAIEGTISGNVTDINGDPLQGATVNAWPVDGGQWLSSTTDAAGNYTLGQMATGSYWVSAFASGYALEYFNSGLILDQASPVSANSGTNTPGISFQLDHPSGSISGRVEDETGTGIVGVPVVASLDRCGQNYLGSALTDADGNYLIENLPQGDVFLEAAIEGQNYLHEWYDGSDGTQDCNAAMPFTVTAGTTTLDWTLSSGFTMNGSVINGQESDGSFNTYFYIDVEDDFAGTRPDDIDAISITGPSGPLPYTISDFTFTPPGDFNLTVPGSPELGVYTFTVTSGTTTVQSTDYLYVLRNIPIPDASQMHPAEGSVVTSRTPVFRQALVEFPDTPLFYRLRIVDLDGNIVFSGPRTFSWRAAALPEGILTPGQTYRYRFQVMDHDNGFGVQNATNGAWVTFTMADTLGHPARPAFRPNEWLATTYTTSNGTSFEAYATVVDYDGVAADGSSHTVTVTLPDGTTTYELDYFIYTGSATEGGYEFFMNGTPPSGTYTFTVTDPDGNQSTYQEELVVNPLSPPDETSITPGNQSEYITAAFDNVLVNGAPYDDFDSYASIDDIDRSRWQPWIENITVDGGQLSSTLNNSVGRINGGVTFQNPESINSIQADITVNSISDMDGAPSARINGSFCHNGIGEVWATLYVKGNRVYWSVSEDWINAQNNEQWRNLATGDLMSVSPGQTVTVAIAWNGTQFTFSADGNEDTYAPSGTINPPINPWKGLQARINLNIPGNQAFAWDPVVDANRYRFRVYNGHDSQTILRGMKYDGQPNYQIPPGALKPNSAYKFRLEAWDVEASSLIHNISKTPASNNDNYIFYTTADEPQDPYIDLREAGVRTWYDEAGGQRLNFWIEVHDAQGVPGNIASVTVANEGGNTIALQYDPDNPFASGIPTSGIYRNVGVSLPIASGEYAFRVEDADGNPYQVSETLTADPIGSPSVATMIPANGGMISGSDILFDWDDVPGAAFYSLNVYDQDYRLVLNLHTTASQYLVPEGLLQADTIYQYRILTRREFFEQNIDNMSSSPDFDHMIMFTTGGDTDGDGLPDFWEQQIIDADPGDAIVTIEDVLPGDDFDGDGLDNEGEYLNATDPVDPDSDDDGFTDGQEVAAGSDPNEGGSTPTAFVWTGAVNNDWNEAGNWDLGVVPVEGSDVTIPEGTPAASYTGSGGATTLNELICNGQLSISGTLNVSTDISVGASGTLNLVSILSSDGAVAVAGTMNWSSGTLEGSGAVAILAGGSLNISGTGTKYLHRSLTNNGTLTWNDTGALSGLQGDNPTVIDNQNLFEILGDGDFTYSGTGASNPVLINSGVLRKTAGTGMTEVPVWELNHRGAMEVLSGTLRFAGGGVLAGAMQTAASAILEFYNDTFTVEPDATFTGAGEVRVVYATFTIADGYTLNVTDNLTFQGILDGSGSLMVSGEMDWLEGNMVGTGVTMIATGGTLNISGSAAKYLHRTLTNNGAVVWTGDGAISGISGTAHTIINNAGLFEVQNDVAFPSTGTGDSPVFNNSGVLRKTTGTGTTSFGSWVLNHSGTVDIQTGTMAISGAFTNPAVGTLQGSGILEVSSLTNEGAVNPGDSPGLLTVTGNTSFSGTGTLNIELGGLTVASGYDRLFIDDDAVLAGNLNVSLVNSFAPQLGNQFEILTYTSGSGQFENENLPALTGSLEWNVGYSPTAVVLEVIDPATYDGDGDGLPDSWEQQIIDADPGDAIATIADVLPGDDFDNDGASNAVEYANGISPVNPDSDGDGYNDGQEIAAGTSPLDDTNYQASPERAALMALYNATNGDGWTNNGGWKTPPLAADGFAYPGTECGWYGISCDVDTITAFDLRGNGLIGSIPSEIGNLLDLTLLDLSNNSLNNGIPASMGNLTNLTTLRLQWNGLSGGIPSELGNLTNLADLHLEGNQLSGGIPVSFGNLSNLNALYLHDNQISGSIPTELTNLINLYALYLSRNQLSGSIPLGIDSMTNMHGLYLDGNQFSGTIPPELGNLPNLQSLILSDNQLSGNIPPELGNLNTLLNLHLAANQFIGSVPVELVNLSNLQNDFSDFRWNGLFTTDDALRTFLNGKQNGGDWESTQTVAPGDLSVNDVTTEAVTLGWTAVSYQADPGGYEVEYATSAGGPYTLVGEPASKAETSFTVAGLSMDTDYYFRLRTVTDPHADNQNTVVSSATAPLLAHTVFDPDTDGDGLPDSWEQQIIDADPGDGIETIADVLPGDDFDNDGASNEVEFATGISPVNPDSDGDGYNDGQELAAGTSPLDDTDYLPSPERAALMALYNATNGDGWTDNSGWKTPPLAADGFALPGTECGWFGVVCDTDQINEINLDNNNLSGSIPAALGGLSSLRALSLSANSLTGPIPPELGSLSSLQGLYLNGNQLDGSIPPSLGTLPALVHLYLDDNLLSGIVPPELGSLSLLTHLYLDNNQLSGSIPEALGTLSNLEALYLYSNQLSGAIPSALGSLTNLQALYLNDNQLSGSIPPELGGLSALIHFYAGNNQLSGNLPAALGSLSALTHLYLNDNAFDGNLPVELGSLTNLEALYLNNNMLGGAIPAELGSLASLQAIYIYGNHLTGIIPSTLLNLTDLVDGASDLRWNALYTTDDALRTFLNLKQTGGDWESTQTVAPADLAASDVEPDAVTLTWTAVAYQADPGGYEIEYANDAGGPYTFAASIGNKAETTFTVTGLSASTDYYFRLRTFTDTHTNNQNAVSSDYTEPLFVQTPLEPGADTDGDGWPDLAETQAGSDPNNENEFPEQTYFYVGGAGAENYALGDQDHPILTLEEAVNRIDAVMEASYVINLSSNMTIDLTETLVLNKNTVIVGNGATLQNNNDLPIALVISVGAEDVTLQGLTVRDFTTGIVAISEGGCLDLANVIVEACDIGLDLAETYQLQVDLGASVIQNCGTGLRFAAGSSSNVVTNGTLANNTGDGIRFEGGNETPDSNRVENVAVQDNGGNGIAIYDGSENVLTGNQVTGNNTSRSGYGGIAVFGGGTLINTNLISGNQCYGVYADEALSTQPVEATGNDWGDASGPLHPETNPSGLGDTVSDYVIFSPWVGMPSGADTDGDGWPDLAENQAGTNPGDPDDYPMLTTFYVGGPLAVDYALGDAAHPIATLEEAVGRINGLVEADYRIELAAGVEFILAAPLILHQNTVLAGNSSAIDGVGGAQTTPPVTGIVVSVGAEDVTLQDLTIRDFLTGIMTTSEGGCLDLVNVTVENCDIGLDLAETYQLQVDLGASVIQSCGTGVRLAAGSSSNVVTNGTVTNNTGDGIRFEGGNESPDANRVENVLVQGNGGNGIVIYEGAENVLTGNQVTGNNTSRAAYGGIAVFGGGNLINANLISGNQCYGVYADEALSTQPVDATGNDWGDASGPLHETLNPTGLGNSVSYYVSFSPWEGMAPDMDSDGDGWPDLAESQAGSNASDPDDYPLLTTLFVGGAGAADYALGDAAHPIATLEEVVGRINALAEADYRIELASNTVFNLTAPLILNQNTVLAGNESTIDGGSDVPAGIIVGIGAEDVRIEDMIIRNFGTGILANTEGGCLNLLNVTVQGCVTGLDLAETFQLQVDLDVSVIQNCGTGLRFAAGSSSNVVTNGTVANNTGDGIRFEGGNETPDSNRVENVAVQDNGGNGIAIYDGAENVLTGNQVTGNNTNRAGYGGIAVFGGGTLINTNLISGNQCYGVYADEALSTQPVEATGNDWGDASGPLHETLNPTGMGNAVSDYVNFSPWEGMAPVMDSDGDGWPDLAESQAGTNASDPDDYPLLTTLFVGGAGAADYALGDAAHPIATLEEALGRINALAEADYRIELASNTVFNLTAPSILNQNTVLAGNGAVLDGSNGVQGNMSTGLLVSPGAENVTIQSVTIQNFITGIDVNSQGGCLLMEDVLVENCETGLQLSETFQLDVDLDASLIRNCTTGIRFAAGSSSNVVQRGVVVNNAGDGIRFEGGNETPDANRVEDVGVQDNGGNGIAVYDGANNILVGNTITGNNTSRAAYGGIAVFGGGTLVNQNLIAGNQCYGIYADEALSTQPVNAYSNQWGDASGPFHPTLNPNGLGDAVSDYVMFEVDADNDGLWDWWEEHYFGSTDVTDNPDDDPDGDGLTTAQEMRIEESNPLVPVAIRITAPQNQTILGQATTIAVEGTSQGASQITVEHLPAGTAQILTADMENWSADISLVPGTNQVIVTADDGSGHSAVDSLTVTVDNATPVIAIESPTPESSYEAVTDFITVSGGVSDDTSVTVAWVRQAGGDVVTGTAGGAVEWVASDIPLVTGENNVITVTATDLAGNTASAAITVTRAETVTEAEVDLTPAVSAPIGDPLDLDGDLYANQDETDCGSDPQSAASLPVNTTGRAYPTDSSDPQYNPDRLLRDANGQVVGAYLCPDCKHIDDDGDGMPDQWEETYGLNPNDAADASGDLDGDGDTNLEEFQNGTDPTQAPSVTLQLVVTDMSDQTGYDAWLPVYGRTLRVEAIWSNGIPSPSLVFELRNTSRYPGRAMNDPVPGPGVSNYPDWYEYDGFDFGLTADPAENSFNQQPVTIAEVDGRYTAYVRCWDYAGRTKIVVRHATDPNIRADIWVPKGAGSNGIGSAWSHDSGSVRLDANADADAIIFQDPDAYSAPLGDGFNNFEEYRGVIYTEGVGDDLPRQHRRLNPLRKDLFIRTDGFDDDYPFALGNAIADAGIDVHDTTAWGHDATDDRTFFSYITAGEVLQVSDLLVTGSEAVSWARAWPGFEAEFRIVDQPGRPWVPINGENFISTNNPVQLLLLEAYPVPVANGPVPYQIRMPLPRLNVMIVKLDRENGGVFGSEEGYISYTAASAPSADDPYGSRHWIWSTKGIAYLAQGKGYGLAAALRIPLDHYFNDTPYQKVTVPERTAAGQLLWRAPDLTAGSPDLKLQPLNMCEDFKDGGKEPGSDAGPFEDGYVDAYIQGLIGNHENGQWDGDRRLRSREEWDSGHLNPFDIDQNGYVELPTAFNPDAADGNFDNQHDHNGRPYDMARVIQHTVTHEMIHVLARWGEHSADTKDVMYKYSKDWRRDDYVSDWYRSLMRVYNE